MDEQPDREREREMNREIWKRKKTSVNSAVKTNRIKRKRRQKSSTLNKSSIRFQGDMVYFSLKRSFHLNKTRTLVEVSSSTV